MQTEFIHVCAIFHNGFGSCLLLGHITKKEDADTDGSHLTHHKRCVTAGRFMGDAQEVSG